MTQSSKNFPAYFTEFHYYAKKTRWNKSALINQLIKSLNSKLKVAFIEIKLPKIVIACTNVINSLYNDILHFAPKYMP